LVEFEIFSMTVTIFFVLYFVVHF